MNYYIILFIVIDLHLPEAEVQLLYATTGARPEQGCSKLHVVYEVDVYSLIKFVNNNNKKNSPSLVIRLGLGLGLGHGLGYDWSRALPLSSACGLR